jgi:hypothetical protein
VSKFGKYKSESRIKDALISNATNGQTESFLSNYAILSDNLKKNWKNMFMDYAMMSVSKDIVEFLVSEEAICNYALCIYDCKYNRMHEVYDLITEMINKYGSFTKNTIYLSKSMILERIISPEKISANQNRLSYIIDLMRSKYISVEEVRLFISNEISSDKNGKYKGALVMLNRELLLNEIGI